MYNRCRCLLRLITSGWESPIAERLNFIYYFELFLSHRINGIWSRVLFESFCSLRPFARIFWSNERVSKENTSSKGNKIISDNESIYFDGDSTFFKTFPAIRKMIITQNHVKTMAIENFTNRNFENQGLLFSSQVGSSKKSRFLFRVLMMIRGIWNLKSCSLDLCEIFGQVFIWKFHSFTYKTDEEAINQS